CLARADRDDPAGGGGCGRRLESAGQAPPIRRHAAGGQRVLGDVAARLRSTVRRLAVLLALGAGACMPPSWGANALLHPQRRPATRQPTRPFDAVEFDGAGVKLKGWWFHAAAPRGTVVFLHGVADNRGSSLGVADHFLARGFDVVAYDSRAHGE